MFTAWTTRVSNPVCSHFRLQRQCSSGGRLRLWCSFASYGFYTSTSPLEILDNQFQTQFGVEPRDFTSDLTIRYPALRPINPNNACTLRITAAAGTKLAGASFMCTIKPNTCQISGCFSTLTELYNRRFLTHAALLRRAFAHCAIFPTAASRRSLDRVSVPVWRIVLSDPLDNDALVGHYPTIKLMSRRPIFQRMHCKEASFLVIYSSFNYSCGISSDFSELSPTKR